MGISPYLGNLRSLVGHQLLMMPSVAAIVRNESGQILFILRADNGNWDLPAGSIDPGESPAQAVVREVREETGLHVEPIAVAGVFGGECLRLRYGNGDVVEYTVTVFDCRVVGGELANLDGEAAELHFMEASKRPSLWYEYPDALFVPTSERATLFF
jgi:8-oxo-dGTP pyrophosphatase MutT (NUDIX family)